jgi:Uma2 family endonuclease
MASAAKPRYITPEEYLAFDRNSPIKNEYYDGNIYPMIEPIRGMAGASFTHNQIFSNLFGGLHGQLKGSPCQIYGSDFRVLADRSYTYPDLVAVCGECRFSDGQFDILLNPTLLVEILSPSTESWDRGGKFEHYKRLESLREYVLIAQDRMRVELFTRQGDEWIPTILERPDDVLQLASIGCAVPLAEIYARVEFPPA